MPIYAPRAVVTTVIANVQSIAPVIARNNAQTAVAIAIQNFLDVNLLIKIHLLL